MRFLYGTVFGRLLLKILLNAKVLELSAKWLRSPYSKWLIKYYIAKYDIDMTPFAGQTYDSFADFFARKKDAALEPAEPAALISPCDGHLSFVPIEKNSRFYVKGSWYSIHDLLPDRELARQYKNGLCMIFRLSAKDYHHFCYIDDCYCGAGHLIPGTLHSVQPAALEREPVFRLNRRMWSILKTDHFGSVAQIEVGAVYVGGMVHEKKNVRVRRGEDMGHFELCGSTIILLFTKEVKERLRLNETIEKSCGALGECAVEMGMEIGALREIQRL